MDGSLPYGAANEKGALLDNLPGQRFQNLVALLERLFSHDQAVTIESPKRLPDKDTGNLREHDVVISRTDHHGTFYTALECRDRSRPVGVDAVEGFRTKLDATGVHRGIIVSASGFQESAKQKAMARGIGCVEFSEVEALPWFELTRSRQYIHRLTRVSFNMRLTDQPPAPITFFDSEGHPIGSDALSDTGAAILMGILEQVLPAEVFQIPSEPTESVSITVQNPGLYAIDGAGRRWDAAEIDLAYVLAVYDVTANWHLRDYKGLVANKDVAVAEIPFPGLTATLAVVREQNGFSIALSKKRSKD